MARKQAVKSSKKRKVIPISLDATFFFERAVRSLDRFHYDKALKYFRRAVDFEPDNPVNHCNMAGVLSEIGNYEESNQVLRGVIEHIDPTMTECYFYMANNYANMENYEQAEKSLVYYLEHDPDGFYLEECEEMMEWLSFELERPVTLDSIKSREGVFEHDKARMLLEKGQFEEAIGMLERFVSKYPDFLAAYNNLALAYYYMGDLDASLRSIEAVLDKDKGNIHALCNLAIYHLHSGHKEKLLQMKEMLVRMRPFQMEYVFKLGMTLAILGEHEAAFRQFKRLVRSGEQETQDQTLYHYTAVAAWNAGREQEALHLWDQASRMSGSVEVARFYLAEARALSAVLGRRPEFGYQYHLPFEDPMRQMDGGEHSLPDMLRRDPIVRASLFWALFNSNEQVKQQAIHMLTKIADKEVEKSLREYVLRPEESEYLKKLAIFALRTMGTEGPLPAVLDNCEVVVPAQPVHAQLPEWQEPWQQILNIAQARMSHRYDIVQCHDLQTLWVEYLTRTYPQVPRFYKLEGWAAALEYLTAKMHRIETSYGYLAAHYEVSEATIRKHVRTIDQTCGLHEKMNAVFPTFGNEW